MNQNQQSQLKDLITKGKEQGFLTYSQVNDHLPDDIVDPEQIEDIINMIAMAVARLCGSAKLWIADNATDPPAAATNVDANWKVNAPKVSGYKKAAANRGADAP